MITGTLGASSFAQAFLRTGIAETATQFVAQPIIANQKERAGIKYGKGDMFINGVMTVGLASVIGGATSIKLRDIEDLWLDKFSKKAKDEGFESVVEPDVKLVKDGKEMVPEDSATEFIDEVANVNRNKDARPPVSETIADVVDPEDSKKALSMDDFDDTGTVDVKEAGSQQRAPDTKTQMDYILNYDWDNHKELLAAAKAKKFPDDDPMSYIINKDWDEYKKLTPEERNAGLEDVKVFMREEGVPLKNLEELDAKAAKEAGSQQRAPDARESAEKIKELDKAQKVLKKDSAKMNDNAQEAFESGDAKKGEEILIQKDELRTKIMDIDKEIEDLVLGKKRAPDAPDVPEPDPLVVRHLKEAEPEMQDALNAIEQLKKFIDCTI